MLYVETSLDGKRWKINGKIPTGFCNKVKEFILNSKTQLKYRKLTSSNVLGICYLAISK